MRLIMTKKRDKSANNASYRTRLRGVNKTRETSSRNKRKISRRVFKCLTCFNSTSRSKSRLLAQDPTKDANATVQRRQVSLAHIHTRIKKWKSSEAEYKTVCLSKHSNREHPAQNEWPHTRRVSMLNIWNFTERRGSDFFSLECTHLDTLQKAELMHQLDCKRSDVDCSDRLLIWASRFLAKYI